MSEPTTAEPESAEELVEAQGDDGEAYQDTENGPDTSLDLDANGRPMWLVFYGRKHSGKSELARCYVESWPYDALIIDPTGDFDPEHRHSMPWPGGSTWPERPEGMSRAHWRLKPNRRDPASIKVGNRSVAAYLVEVDAAILAAHDHPEPVLIHIDDTPEEWLPQDGVALPGGRTLLSESRHGKDFVTICGPRPIGHNPKALSQADSVFLFQMPHEADVDRIATTTGVPAEDLRAVMESLEEHGFARIDQLSHSIAVYPPLPLH